MSDAATTAKSPKKGASKAKKQPKPTHPSYKIMIAAAIKNLKERSGSSRQAILKYIVANYKVGDEKKAGVRLRLALRKAVTSGDIKQVKGSGASGSFKLAKDEKAPVKVAKKTPKKSPAKAKKAGTAAPKKASKLKKPAAKKASTPKKPAAKKAKKPSPAAKKTPKKPAAKKTAAKKSKK